MNSFLVVNFCFLVCLLVQHSSCLNCYVTKNWESESETAIGFDESKLTQLTCNASSVCFIEDKYAKDGKLGKFN